MQGHYILRVPDTSPSRCQEIGPDRVTWLPETDPARALAFGCREAGRRMPQQALRRRLARASRRISRAARSGPRERGRPPPCQPGGDRPRLQHDGSERRQHRRPAAARWRRGRSVLTCTPMSSASTGSGRSSARWRRGRSVLTCTPMSSASTGSGRSSWSSRCVASARARASTFGGVARRPASHVRYDSGDTPSMAANEDCDWPSAIRHARSVRGSTTPHHAIGAGRCEALGWRSAYFSQPILEGDRSLFSPVPSPPVPRQRAQSANSLGKWRARQDSNLRPSA